MSRCIAATTSSKPAPSSPTCTHFHLAELLRQQTNLAAVFFRSDGPFRLVSRRGIVPIDPSSSPSRSSPHGCFPPVPDGLCLVGMQHVVIHLDLGQVHAAGGQPSVQSGSDGCPQMGEFGCHRPTNRWNTMDCQRQNGLDGKDGCLGIRGCHF